MASKSKFECELWSSLVSRVVDETRPDVIFKIVEGDLSSEIQAHKHVLGMVSLTFRNMFRNMPAEVIEIKETTEQAFGVMVDAVYNKSPIEASLADKSVDEIFAVVNLAKIYMISELMEDLKQFISSFPLTDETLLVVAAEAMEYRNLFEEEAGHLLLTCANYLKPKLMDARSIFRYVDENVANKEVVATLLAMMNNIAPTGCHNCLKDPCQNGAGVKANELRVGLIVTNLIVTNDRIMSSYWVRGRKGTSWGKGRVIEVGTGDQVKVEGIEGGLFEAADSEYKTIPAGHIGSGSPSLRFCCQ